MEQISTKSYNENLGSDKGGDLGLESGEDLGGDRQRKVELVAAAMVAQAEARVIEVTGGEYTTELSQDAGFGEPIGSHVYRVPEAFRKKVPRGW